MKQESEMSDLVKRLRASLIANPIIKDAADEITHLTALVAEQQRQIAEMTGNYHAAEKRKYAIAGERDALQSAASLDLGTDWRKEAETGGGTGECYREGSKFTVEYRPNSIASAKGGGDAD
jgi:hypothetical protein